MSVSTNRVWKKKWKFSTIFTFRKLIRTLALKKSKKVKAHTSQRPKRPELIQVSLAWNMPKGIATVAYSIFPCDSGSSVSR